MLSPFTCVYKNQMRTSDTFKGKDLCQINKVNPAGNAIYYPPPVIQWTNSLVPKKKIVKNSIMCLNINYIFWQCRWLRQTCSIKMQYTVCK